MELCRKKREAIIQFSLSYLGRQWNSDFDCIVFVREVYRKIGIEIPPISSRIPPPHEFNITERDLNSWLVGLILFLKRNKYNGKRTWTHVAITLPEEKVIHCSDYFGTKVSITPKEEIFSFYHYVLSR